MASSPCFLESGKFDRVPTMAVIRVLYRQSRYMKFAFEATHKMLWIFRGREDILFEPKLETSWILLGRVPCLRWSPKKMKLMDTPQPGLWWTWNWARLAESHEPDQYRS